MHSVQGGDVLSLQQLGDPLVGEDHQLLDQGMGLGLWHRAGPDDVAVLEVELGLEALHLERSSGAALCEHGSGPARELDRPDDRFGGPLAPGEDPVEMVVVEPSVGANQTSVEALRARLPRRRELDLRGDGEAMLAGGEAAGLVGRAWGSIGSTVPGT